MKAIILSVLLAGPVLAGDLTFKVGGAEYRLTDQPCRVPAANEAIKTEFAGQQRAGWQMTRDRTIAFCWLVVDGNVILMDEDGRIAVGPLELFKPEPGA